MANLETLELTINANAESASEGLKNLINSLSALSKKVGSSVGGLKRLNAELATLKGFKGVSFPGSSSKTLGNVEKTTKAIKKQQKALEDLKDYDWGNNRAVNKAGDTFSQAKYDEDFKRAGEKYYAKMRADSARNAAWRANWATAIQSGKPIITNADVQPVTAEQVQAMAAQQSASASRPNTLAKAGTIELVHTARSISAVGEASQSSSSKVSFFARALDKAKEVGHSATKGFSRISRIFSTMLIRTAIRSFMKEMSSAWDACYNFSKQMGGEFAQSVDKAKTLLAGTAINIVKTFAPAIQALLPVISAVASAIQYLCNAIQSLFSLLGMSSGLWGASADSIQKYSKAAGGGSKANKEMLASFDELNVISSESGGGGGGGGGAAYTGFSDVISAEFDAITSLLVNEGLIALGLILACTGHIPLGLGLIAVGAAGMVKLLTEDWNKLPGEVKSTISKITAIVGTASLALGAILLCTGNIPLGLGLIALGAGNLAASIAPNWTAIINGVTGAFNTISGIVSDAWENIKTGASNAWEYIKRKWEDTGIGPAIRGTWDGIKDFFAGFWEFISRSGDDAWNMIKIWWNNSTLGIAVKNTWEMLSTELGKVWKTVIRAADDAWNFVKIWWENSGLGKAVTKTWNLLSGALQTVWNTVTRAAEDAWNLVKIWWENSGLGEKVRSLWSVIQTTLSNVWNTVTRAADDAWNFVKIWWENSGLGTKVRDTWETVRSFFINTLWNPVKMAVTNAWNAIEKWWNNNIYSNISAAWANVVEIFRPILNIVESIWNFIQKITGTHEVNLVGNVSVPNTTENTIAKTIINNAKNSSNPTTKVIGNIFDGLFGVTGGGGSSGGHGFAEGGFPTSGDLFFANENGIPEYIASMGNRTAVANNDQIVEGISRGVSEGQAEQNTLLRQQNELLRGILEKDASVRIGASAALGRVTRQSLDMYGAMVGG